MDEGRDEMLNYEVIVSIGLDEVPSQSHGVMCWGKKRNTRSNLRTDEDMVFLKESRIAYLMYT